MPSVTLEIPVSRREADRPRLLQITALDADDHPVEGLTVALSVDYHGTFAGEDAVRQRSVVIGSHGIAIFQWYEWPRNGPARDFVSTITATWEDPALRLYIEDLYE